MKLIYNLFLILCAFFMTSCQEDIDLQGSNGTGYLLLTVNGSNETTTRSANLPPGYTGHQIAVEIINSKDSVVDQTDDWQNWEKHLIELPVGQYTIKAYSYGFDGKQSAMAAPYYYGTKTINIEKDKKLQETVTCKLANVKMSVKIADELKEAFKSFTIYVTSKEAGKCDPIYFNINLSATAIKDTAYFPATDLVVKYAATNLGDQKNEATRELTGVKGNDHYILNFTLGKAENGNGDVTVEVDETLHTYEYTFTVSQTPTNGAQLSANAWAKFAYLKAENVTATSGMDLTQLKLQYRQKDSEDWVDLETNLNENEKVYTATAPNLTSNTTYLYRLTNGGDFKSDSLEFTTEDATALQNAGFADWSTIQIEGIFGNSVNTAYPNASASVSFWDTSNKGANSMSTQDPTKSVNKPVIEGSKDNMAAMLQSKKVVIAFAAASLYTGTFGAANTSTMSATVNFGQPFTSRPIALHGYYQYTPVTIDNVDNDRLQAAGLPVKEGDMDECAIYVALTTDVITVDNSDVKKLFDPNDDRVIAYGALPSGAQTNSENNNGYVEFNIPLEYKSLDTKPTHIMVVCTSSKYGDYMTGGAGSTLYVDDFELVYDGTPTIWE